MRHEPRGPVGPQRRGARPLGGVGEGLLSEAITEFIPSELQKLSCRRGRWRWGDGVAGVSKLLVSLGHTGRRAVWGHTLNTQTLRKTDEQKNGFM